MSEKLSLKQSTTCINKIFYNNHTVTPYVRH